MPRKSRESSVSNFYHVIVQGINKEKIFADKKDIKRYKQIILEKLKESNVTILAYCIMNNHTHLLIHSEKSKDLSKFMQRVNISYSQYYNKRNMRIGYVFRDRYYSQDITTENQLYNCIKYIHNNPVKANIVKKAEEYEYSSYNEFIGRPELINCKSLKLIFETMKDYKEKFYKIHKTNNYEEEFYDIKDKDIYELIREIELKNGKKLKELIKNKNTLKIIIKLARKETKVTIIELSKILGISKSSIWNYEKK